MLLTTRHTAAGLMTLLLMAAAGTASAQGWIEPNTHRFIPGSAVERVRSDVTVTVDGIRRVAVVEVEEIFRNRSGTLMEGDYLYPIPPEAVFTNFSLFMGETELRGEVLPADQARKIYEEIELELDNGRDRFAGWVSRVLRRVYEVLGLPKYARHVRDFTGTSKASN